MPDETTAQTSVPSEGDAGETDRPLTAKDLASLQTGFNEALQKAVSAVQRGADKQVAARISELRAELEAALGGLSDAVGSNLDALVDIAPDDEMKQKVRTTIQQNQAQATQARGVVRDRMTMMEEQCARSGVDPTDLPHSLTDYATKTNDPTLFLKDLARVQASRSAQPPSASAENPILTKLAALEQKLAAISGEGDAGA